MQLLSDGKVGVMEPKKLTVENPRLDSPLDLMFLLR